MWNRIGFGIELIAVIATAVLGLLWAITQDGWYEPYTVLLGVAVPTFEAIRRIVGHLIKNRVPEKETYEEDKIDSEREEEIGNVKVFGEKFSELLEKNRGYILAQFISLSQLTDLESWKRAAADGTLKQFAKLCDARNSFMASPDAVGLMSSLSKVKNFILSMPKGMNEEDLKQMAAHKKWSELTTKLAKTGPRSDAEVESWLELTRDFLNSCLTATAVKDRHMKDSIRKWIAENESRRS